MQCSKKYSVKILTSKMSRIIKWDKNNIQVTLLMVPFIMFSSI